MLSVCLILWSQFLDSIYCKNSCGSGSGLQQVRAANMGKSDFFQMNDPSATCNLACVPAMYATSLHANFCHCTSCHFGVIRSCNSHNYIIWNYGWNYRWCSVTRIVQSKAFVKGYCCCCYCCCLLLLLL